MIREAMEGGRDGIHWEMGQRRRRLATITSHCKNWAGYAPLHCDNRNYFIGVSTVWKRGKKFPWRRLSSILLLSA